MKGWGERFLLVVPVDPLEPGTTGHMPRTERTYLGSILLVILKGIPNAFFAR